MVNYWMPEFPEDVLSSIFPHVLHVIANYVFGNVPLVQLTWLVISPTTTNLLQAFTLSVC